MNEKNSSFHSLLYRDISNLLVNCNLVAQTVRYLCSKINEKGIVMMDTEHVVLVLEAVGIRPTATRILVYKSIADLKDTFSLADIEEQLDSVDKSTVFRTLVLFQSHHLIHSIDDGSGSIKYCLCKNKGECNEEEGHCHFYCTQCRKTFCLDELPTPNISLPQGFEMQQINYIVKGICASCATRKH